MRATPASYSGAGNRARAGDAHRQVLSANAQADRSRTKPPIDCYHPDAFQTYTTRRRCSGTSDWQRRTAMTTMLGDGRFKYEVKADWGKLPDGWELKDVAAVAVDKQDRVYVFNRG